MGETFNYQPVISEYSLNPEWQQTEIEAKTSIVDWQNQKWLCFDGKVLTNLSCLAYEEINHYLRTSHIEKWRSILDDKDASPNDRYVAFELLKNVNISAAGELPMCQDTGTAIISCHKGTRVYSGDNDEQHIARGVYDAYKKHHFRYSQVAPLSMFEERNTKNNLPAQIDIHQGGDATSYHFLFIAKGGGSANKSSLYQTSPRLLNKQRMLEFIKEKMQELGTSACPPYHIAIVIGGTSAEMTLHTAKMASCHSLDNLPNTGNEYGRAFRDLELESQVMKISRNIGIGAQFGGKYFCLDARVIRLPRHGASLPIAIAVSCSADRQIEAKITKEGVFIEKLEHDPARFLHDAIEQEKILENQKPTAIDLNVSMNEIRAQLANCPVKSRVSLNGTLIVARDLAHLRISQDMAKGKKIPQYMLDHPVYYAGPAKTPKGKASGSFGPTTSSRMDSYVEEFQSKGGSMVMLAKGNRTKKVCDSCKKHGGFYLGSIGGPAAILAERSIKKVTCIDFEDLGMEAVWKIEVKDFPAFVVIDDKGNDFFKSLRIDKS